MAHRARLVNLAVVLVAVTVALGAAEIVLRIWLPVRGVIYNLHPRYLYAHIPGGRRLADAGDGRWPGVLVRINAAGRRGDESGLASGAHRVLVYGDSFMAAEDTPEPDTFAAVLERELTLRTGPTEVLNAGVTGYGPDQILLRMEDELRTLRPQVVVVGLFAGNDFGDLLRNKLFRLSPEGAALPNAPVVEEGLRREFTAPLAWSSIQVIRAAQSATQRWRARPAAPDTAAARPDRTATRLANRIAEYDSYVVAGDNTVRNFMADEYDADVALQPASPSAVYRRRLMAAILDRMRGLADASGARLLVLVIPEWCDAGGVCDEVAARRGFAAYRPDGLTSALADLARAQSVFHLNLFEPFTAAGVTGLYYPRDQHWNPAGQRVAAEHVADLVAGAGWLSIRPPAR